MLDKKRGLINVIVSILFKVVILITNIFVIRFLIKYIGNDINGLNSLFLSIIGFLSVAELGIGSAITYCMYKPVVDGDEDKVAALYCLFKKLYIIIGAVILVIGIAVTPLLPYLIKDYETIRTKTNVYLTFIIMLVSVLVTYAYSAKSSLINAYKNNYVTTTVYSCGLLLQYGLQIIVTIFTHSFVWYLVSRIVSVVGQWVVTEIIVRKKYGRIIKNKRKVDEDTKKEVTKNVKAMFMHKLGNVLVNTADSVIISTFISAAFLGVYSNYVKIMNAMITIIGLVFTQLTSVIGHMYVENNKETVIKYFNFFHTLNFIISIIFFLGYYAVIDNIVSICFGANLELADEVTFVITINYFIQFMRQATLLFRDATGTFYYDRWKALLEGVLNIALSIGFVFLMGVVGVIIATIITNIFICHIVEPHVLYKYALNTRTTRYYIRNYLYILAFAITLVVLNFCLRTYDNQWIELLVNGCIAVAIAVVPCAVAAVADKDFRHYFHNITKKIKNKFTKEKNKEAGDNMEEMTLREIQLAELDILIEFDKICKENDLKYSVSCGTLLGAIRHSGFIPWDDDIDVEMPRPDYEKLVSLIENKEITLKDGYELIKDRGTEATYPWVKILDTSYKTESFIVKDGINGLFIDIFPLDGYNGDMKKALKTRKKIQKLKRLLAYNYLTFNNFSGFKKFLRKLYSIYAKGYSPEKLVAKINKLALSCPYENSVYVGCLNFKPAGIIGAFTREEIEDTVDVDFEGHKFKAYKCYDRYLTALYGDYMTLPKESDRVSHTLKCTKIQSKQQKEN